MRSFVWHPQTNPFPKTKVDRFNRKKPFLKMSDTLVWSTELSLAAIGLVFPALVLGYNFFIVERMTYQFL